MNGKEAGWEAFGQADWEGARGAFSGALEENPGDPEALDGLGQALWWLGERDAAIDRRREAYAAYQRAGEARRAGGVATYLAGEHRIDGQEAAGSGWLSRARRLLAGEETGPEHGWFAIEEAKRAVDAAEAERHSQAALDIANELSNPDIECMALAQLGSATVRQGRVDEGVALLDEAMTVALGGETLDPLACGDACCTTLVVCDGLEDLDRATQWCEAVVEFTERRHFTPVQQWCRGIYGGVLVRAGDWERAESVLTEALRDRPDRRKGEGRVLPLATLAGLRIRQGRPEEAESLLDGIEGNPAALAPLVQLHLQRGETETAQALLSGGDEAEEDGVALTLRAEVALAAGDLAAAASFAERLGELAERLAREDYAAAAAMFRGRIAVLRDDTGTAVAELDDAVARFAALGLPLEEARARLALGGAQATQGSPLAVRSARAARGAFVRLGARRDADQASALLRDLGASGRTTTRGDRDELTPREREVLALLGAGLSNAEIAERLVIAPKTAEHHVSHVLSKLGVRSRAEAAAHAARQGL